MLFIRRKALYRHRAECLLLYKSLLPQKGFLRKIFCKFRTTKIIPWSHAIKMTIQCYSTYRKQLNLCNIVLCLLVGTLLFIACLSYSTDDNLVSTFYFGIGNYKPLAQDSSPCDNPLSSYSLYLAPMAISLCNEAQYCGNKFLGPRVSTCQTFSWDAITILCQSQNKNQLNNLALPTQFCPLSSLCKTEGSATFAFLLISASLAYVNTWVFVLRRKSDTEFRRLVSILLSLAAMVTSILSSALFLPCTSQFNKYATTISAPVSGLNALTTAYGYPMVISVCSFLTFIYVSTASYSIPLSVPAPLLKNDYFSSPSVPAAATATNKI